jgi:hypothetical protein
MSDMWQGDIISYNYTVPLHEGNVVEFPAGSDMWFEKGLIICLHCDDEAENTSSSRLWSGDDMVSPEAFDEINEVAYAFQEDGGGTTVYMQACKESIGVYYPDDILVI